jgi:hypothetical protein
MTPEDLTNRGRELAKERGPIGLARLAAEQEAAIHVLLAKLQTMKDLLPKVRSALVCLKETPMAGLPVREKVVEEALAVVCQMEST